MIMMTDENFLTTDSVPSPPRESINPTPTNESPKLNINEYEQNLTDEKPSTTERISPEPEKTSSKEKTKPKVKKPKAFKSQVVNINVSHTSGFHLGHNFTFGSPIPQKYDTPLQDPLVKTPAIKALFKNESPVSKDQLHDISPYIGKEWIKLGRTLGLKQGMIEQIEENNRKNQEEIIYQMLLEWYQSNGSKATVKWLCEALEISLQFDAIRTLANE